jgi:hypothetical protein
MRGKKILHQLDREKKQKKRRLLVKKWAVILAVFFLINFSIKLINNYRNSIWDGNYRLNFVITNTQNLYLASFDPRNENITLMKIPPNTILEVPYGYGKYQVQFLEKLEEIENRPDLTEKTVRENFGLAVDGWVRVGEGDPETKRNFEKLIFQLVEGKGKTNFSVWDIWRLWWQARKVKETDFQKLNLEQMGVFTKDKLPDQSWVLLLDKAVFDQRVRNIFNDQMIRLENLSVVVLNGTDYSGLAERLSRILVNSGVNVVAVGNSEEPIKSCLVKSPKSLKGSKTVALIRRLWNCLWQEENEAGRADISLILGQDYLNFLMEKNQE